MILLKNVSNMVTCANPEGKAKRGKTQNDIYMVKNGYLLFNGTIKYLGNESGFRKYIKQNKIKNFSEIDCTGKTVMPGFVDSHTHLVHAGSRADEYEMKIQGKSYEEIANAGGGIAATVKAVRKSTKTELLKISEKRLRNFIKYGTTTLEAKSGYGLDVKNELKLLEVINELSKRNKFGVDIIPTFLGAHSIPTGISKREYLDMVCFEMIPQAAKRRLAVFIDIFCEKGYFDARDTEQILSLGARFGLIPKVHTDQFYSIGGIGAAMKVKAISVDHLEVLNPKGINQLIGTDIIATLLPGCSYFLNMVYPPARKLIESGVPVALATDFNPGSCNTENMQMIMSLASLKMKMTAEEIINAVTVNGAFALNIQNKTGSLTCGKQSDILVFDFPGYKDLIYHFGVNQPEKVFVKGKSVFSS